MRTKSLPGSPPRSWVVRFTPMTKLTWARVAMMLSPLRYTSTFVANGGVGSVPIIPGPICAGNTVTISVVVDTFSTSNVHEPFALASVYGIRVENSRGKMGSNVAGISKDSCVSEFVATIVVTPGGGVDVPASATLALNRIVSGVLTWELGTPFWNIRNSWKKFGSMTSIGSAHPARQSEIASNPENAAYFATISDSFTRTFLSSGKVGLDSPGTYQNSAD